MKVQLLFESKYGEDSIKWVGDSTLFRVKQVHGTRIVEFKPEMIDQPKVEADGIFCAEKNMAIAISTADCVPILLGKKDGSAIGALHAGWRGTLSNIIRQFFLLDRVGKASDWRAWIGPSIGPCCYEVSEELILQFKGQFPSLSAQSVEPSPRKFDLRAINRNSLLESGVADIEISQECTCCFKINGNYAYNSYRRDKTSERQNSVVRIKP